MTRDVLNVIGTIAFAISGAIIAMEEDYDIFGIAVLGLTTAFGGGMIRNLLIGIPVDTIWNQHYLFEIALLSIIIVYFIPNPVIRYWNKWGTFFDAIGLAAFSIQGANFAVQSGAPLSAVIIASTLTGVGGGLVRDLLAGRKPLIFQSEIYAAWGILTGMVFGLHWVHGTVEIMILFMIIVSLRVISVMYKWSLPKQFISRTKEKAISISGHLWR